MRKVPTILTAIAAVSVFLTAPVGAVEEAGSPPGTERADVVREWNDNGTSAPGTAKIGISRLQRSPDGLKARVSVEGLTPGGVYTFWWVVPHSLPPTIPDDVFVARGAAKVVGADGRAVVNMSAYTGQPGIEGFPLLGGAEWHALTDPMNSVVRVEIAYHGQKSDAGSDISQWRSDFWTGSACPTDAATPQGAVQPHCPVYFAATHLP